MFFFSGARSARMLPAMFVDRLQFNLHQAVVATNPSRGSQNGKKVARCSIEAARTLAFFFLSDFVRTVHFVEMLRIG